MVCSDVEYISSDVFKLPHHMWCMCDIKCVISYTKLEKCVWKLESHVKSQEIKRHIISDITFMWLFYVTVWYEITDDMLSKYASDITVTVWYHMEYVISPWHLTSYVWYHMFHLESWPHGINIYRLVCTMYVQSMYNALVQQLTDMVCTNIENHKHVHTCIYISANVLLCMCFESYKHVCTR